MDALILLAGVVVFVTVAAVASLVVGGVPARKPPTAPNGNGGLDVWPFF